MTAPSMPDAVSVTLIAGQTFGEVDGRPLGSTWCCRPALRTGCARRWCGCRGTVGPGGGRRGWRSGAARCWPRTASSPPRSSTALAHGTADESAPFEHSAALRDALVAAGGEVEFVAIEGTRHNWLAGPGRYPGESRVRDFGPLALAFFRRHLRS